MTPNRNEAFGLAGIYCSEPVTPVENDTALMKVAEVLMKTWGPDYLLITLGAQGMALFEKNGDFVVIPTQAREVYDVSGAGDTVISAFSLALISGATGEEAAIFANHAAGVVVGKVGTVSVDIHEVYESFQDEEK
jgi:D-beta-D-heptose 7-phosphate kinase/D-beta-D-heptose 1-phosphate adenosyltransferase